MTQLTITIKAGKVAANALPVRIDPDWLGCTMTSDNGGIIPSREASNADRKLAQIHDDADDSVVL